MFLLTPGGRHDEWEAPTPELVALDLDGTLIGLSGQVSEAVVAAIARARGAGLHVGLATGRTADAVNDVLDRTGLPGPHVLHNGAEVRRDGEVLASWPVPPAALDKVIAGCVDEDIYLEVYVDGGFHVTRMDERAAPHWQLLGLEPLGVVRGAGDVDGDVPKVTAVVHDQREAAKVIELLEDAGLRPGPAASPATPDLRYVNGTDPEIDKGRALRAAAEVLGIDLAAVVAVGDERNDLSMFEVAGTAIAMGNAAPPIREAAHLVAADVQQHGAAAALDAACSGWHGVSGA